MNPTNGGEAPASTVMSPKELLQSLWSHEGATSAVAAEKSMLKTIHVRDEAIRREARLEQAKEDEALARSRKYNGVDSCTRAFVDGCHCVADDIKKRIEQLERTGQ